MDDLQNEKEIKRLVRKLTSTGKDYLDENYFKQLKRICKMNDNYVSNLAEVLLKYFSKKHAEVRFSCILIVDQIFRKSHCFRIFILTNISTIICLCFGDDMKGEILKPKPAAQNLKKHFIKCIKDWNQNFGQYYVVLPDTMKFLVNRKNVDFENCEALTEHERRVIDEEKRSKNELQLKCIATVRKSLDEIYPQIQKDLLSFRNCLNLLIPNFDDFSNFPLCESGGHPWIQMFCHSFHTCDF